MKQTPPVITTRELLLQKIEAIESLLQVSTAQSIASSVGSGSGSTTHPTDANYEKLKCALSPASAEEVEMVKAYAANTHAATHSSYTMSVRHVFNASREGEAANHKASLGNRMLLWHGSRLTNWVGIITFHHLPSPSITFHHLPSPSPHPLTL